MNAYNAVTRIANAMPSYQQLKVQTDAKHGIAWCYMEAAPRPCFNRTLLKDLSHWCSYLRHHANTYGVRYHVIASGMDEVFNLGGDLELFVKLIRNQDKAGCSTMATSASRFCMPIFGVSTALSRPSRWCKVRRWAVGLKPLSPARSSLRRKAARMGFPEILFNLFPGMGAFNLLSRKLNTKLAERIILGGKLYTAEELYDMGLVDVLAEKGEGELAVYDYIRREERTRNGFQALRQARDKLDPITHEDLRDVLAIWVDTALKLTQRDLRMMERLVSRQEDVAARIA
jgi:DSF synthase